MKGSCSTKTDRNTENYSTLLEESTSKYTPHIPKLTFDPQANDTG